MRLILSFVFILTHFIFFAQLTDDFSDGDFNVNPTWAGTDLEYQVNAGFELQLNNSVAATSYLSTAHNLASLDSKEWKVWTKQSFSPSGSNFGRIYLTSSSADLTTDPDGFYLQLGEAGATDAVRLFKAQATVHTELLAGPIGQIAASSTIGIRVVRDNLGNWLLYIDGAGGEAYTLEGTVNDATALLGTHFGFIDTYTASNATKFYYDNIYVGDEIIDLTPPVLLSATAINANQVDLLFDEPLDQTSSELISNYSFVLGLVIGSAVLDGVNPALVHINVSTPFTNGSSYTISAINIEDILANVAALQSLNFSYLFAETPLPGDVIINEFLCDESPQVGLPLAEYVELFNRTNKVFDLDGWKIGDASSDGTIQQAWLYPGSHIILASTSDVDSFLVVAAVTSFPSLNNSGDNIVLRSDLGLTLDSISYTDDWYHDPNKADGGYSIERINPNDPCTDINDWAASNSSLGGTPGSQNSIYDITPDTELASITNLVALSPNFLEVHFNEGMDSTSLADAMISVAPILTIQNQYVLNAAPTMMTLQFVENITPSQTYSIMLQNISDCWLNSTTYFGEFALPEDPIEGDLIINEILFNPYTGGGDWVEVYNNSDKLLNINDWEIGNFDNDTINNLASVNEHFLIYPGEYLVLADNVLQVEQTYPAVILGRLIEVNLPTYPNDSGTVYLQYQGVTIDKVSYSDDWHFQLLDDEDGKSLERIDADGLSDDKNNWHTAAEAIGFATPGGENSQNYPAITNGDFNYTSETISPDNDGIEDVLQVNYEMNKPGYTGSFTIYDDRGRLIAEIMKSELLETKGTFVWDGIKKDGKKATIGTYIGVFEAFLVNSGDIFMKKAVFVVAGKLKN